MPFVYERTPQSLASERAAESAFERDDATYQELAREVAHFASDLHAIACWTDLPSSKKDLKRMKDILSDLTSAFAELTEAGDA